MKPRYTVSLLALIILALSRPAAAQDPTRVSSIPETVVAAVAADSERLYASTYTDVYVSDDGGADWSTTAALPVDTSDVNALLVHAGVLYVGTNGSGVFASADHGATWTPQLTGLNGNARRISVLAARGDSLYAGTDGAGVYVLNLQSPTGWTSFNQNFAPAGVTALTVSGTTLVASGGPTGSVYVRSQGAGAWTAVPLDVQDPQNQAYEFQPAGPYLLAGTAKGIYRSIAAANEWHPRSTSIPESGDVVSLTSYGARIYATVLHQGYALYSSDDFGTTWTLRHQQAVPVYDLLGAQDRLWIARGDGLWYYELSANPRLLHTYLRPADGAPIHRGSVLASLEGNDLRLVGYFTGLQAPWHGVSLYRGDPAAGGELAKNLYVTFPEGGGYSDGIDVSVALTGAETAELLAGELYLSVRTLGGESQHASGQIQILPMDTPSLFETSVRSLWRGALVPSGTVVATLEGEALRLIGFGRFNSPIGQVSLYRGALGEAGEHHASLWTNWMGEPELVVGLDATLPMSQDLKNDLFQGRLYLEMTTFGGETARAHLFLTTNQAPDASAITAPADGTSIVIGGDEGGDPVDPETPLAEVTFNQASDPEGSPVGHLWQLSRTPDFTTAATVTLDLGTDSTRVPLTVDMAATLFDTTFTGFASLPLHLPLTFHHRVITTDGGAYTVGPASTLILTRGTITSGESPEGMPERFVLHGNYPNPFNPTTSITFDLPAAADVQVEVFNMLGQQVLVLPAGTMAAGASRTIAVDGSSLSSGSYLYRVIMESKAGLETAVGQMVVIK